jgi:ABC-type Fe3+/spermidine/putrescine transport system ATPase subunit
MADRSVLDGFSVALRAGERMAILGPSGCGKTTVLRLVAGLLAPDSGSVALDDKIVSSAGCVLVPPEQRNVGMVFQDLALWPHLTVDGNLRFGLKARKVPRAEAGRRIRKTLELVGLWDRAGSHPGELSGGEQQRVALARALVLEPGVLLMDEPLSSLDFDLALRLRREILQLHEKLRFTLLYVTHNREEAAEIGERVLLMKRPHPSN